MSAAQRLSTRMENGVRYGEAHPVVLKASLIRAILRLSEREGFRLAHGDVKHARDTIRAIEKQTARM